MKKLILFLGLTPCIVIAENYYMEAAIGGEYLSYYNKGNDSMILRLDGGYELNKYVGFELGINDYFKTTISNQDGTFNVNGYGYDFSIIPNIQIAKNQSNDASLNLFFRVGGGYDLLTSSLNSQNSFVDVLGVGLRYNVNSFLTTSVQWIGRGNLLNSGNINYNSNSILASIGILFN